MLSLGVLALMLFSCSDRVQKLYYPDGGVEIENFYINGKLFHKRTYYKNGRLEVECYYKDGKINGSYRSYDSLNRLILTAWFKDDIQDGLCTTYDTSGKVKNHCIVRSGFVNGPSVDYFPNGKVKRKSMVDDNVRRFSLEYDEHGKLVNEFHSYAIFPHGDTLSINKGMYELTVKVFGTLVRRSKVAVVYDLEDFKGHKKEGIIVFSNNNPMAKIDCGELTAGHYLLTVYCPTLENGNPVETLTRVLNVQ